MFEITGTLKVKYNEQKISDSFSKREFVLADDGQYPQFILFQLIKEKCSLLDSFNVGDKIKVSFNLKGREWTSPQNEVKYFNSLDAWRITPANASSPQQPSSYQSSPAAMPTQTASAGDFQAGSPDDDLPF